MYRCLLILSMLFCFSLLDIALSQTCDFSCPCDCNLHGTLNCSGLGVSDVTVCGLMDNFEDVNFSYNNLTELNVVLGGCNHDFSNNDVSIVRLEWFDSYDYYACDGALFDLSHNKIKHLTNGAILLFLTDYFGEILVNLSFNMLESLEKRSLVVTGLDGVFRSTKSMKIDLSFNKLLAIHSNSFDLSPLTDFTEVFLLLNNNNLHDFIISSYLNNMSFEHCLINLHNNNITGFHEDNVEDVLFDNVSLILDDNPWNCDCNQRYVSLNTSRLRHFLESDLSLPPVCERPPLVKTRPLLSLIQSEFRCPPELDPKAELDIHVRELDTLRLSCPVVGADPPITYVDWHFGCSEHIQTCYNCSLEIKNIRKDAGGIYRCTVSKGGENLTITLTVTVGDAIKTTTGSYTSNTIDSRGSVKYDENILITIVICLSIILALVSLGFIFVSYRFSKATRSDAQLPQQYQTSIFRNSPTVKGHQDVTVTNKAFVDEDEYCNVDGNDPRIGQDLYEAI